MNDSKEHILLTSLNLFLQKNFKEVTIKEIVEITGLSKGAFYHYFQSKEQLFEEVMEHFFTDLIITDYSKFSKDSLLQFYTDCLKEKNKKKDASKMINNSKEKTFTANHYFLIFDAMKMLPAFKRQHAKQQEEELNAWTQIISTARKKGEINSEMSNDELAKLFIYSGDGVGINCIMAGNYNVAAKEKKTLWDGLYNTIKK